MNQRRAMHHLIFAGKKQGIPQVLPVTDAIRGGVFSCGDINVLRMFAETAVQRKIQAGAGDDYGGLGF
jgi:hypothetical protein